MAARLLRLTGSCPWASNPIDPAIGYLSYSVLSPFRDRMTTPTITATAAAASEAAWGAIRGSYDLQVHVAPDIIARRIDDLGLAKEFLERGLKGFVT